MLHKITTLTLLRPRFYDDRAARLMLVPLLEDPEPLVRLPSEIWDAVFDFVEHPKTLLTVSKLFSDIALPKVYDRIQIPNLDVLDRLLARLLVAESKWDSLRRSPFPSPNRWIHALDLTRISFYAQTQAMQLDSILSRMFGVVPFLTHLSLNPAFIMSNRTLTALSNSQFASGLIHLTGLTVIFPISSNEGQHALLGLLCSCGNLEELELISQGPDLSELEISQEDHLKLFEDCTDRVDLRKLRSLSILSMSNCPVMAALLCSELPALTKLTLSPYGDFPFPSSLSERFVETHGHKLRSLLLITQKTWPVRWHPSSSTLLETCPVLHHLSLETPVPELQIVGDHSSLRILSIPRPSIEVWRSLSPAFLHVPSLVAVRFRDVRWIRKGMNPKAQHAGVQGEMLEWRRRLRRRGIRVLDSDFREPEV